MLRPISTIAKLRRHVRAPFDDAERRALEQAVEDERARFRDALDQLQHLADHDALTGLVNRRRFTEEVERAIAHTARYGSRGAVLALDLDGFKYVNDTLGHAAGDDLIRRFGTLLGEQLRATDVLARIGGDEFAVILHEVDEHGALQVCEKLLAAVRRHGVVLMPQRHARVTASIGVALFGAGREGATADELLVEADIAMYSAKNAGKDRACAYRAEDQRRDLALERETWLMRLRHALANDAFVLHAQPIVGVAAGGVPRFELLLRLPDEHGDLIPPGTFLANAERFDLIQEIDRWVLRRAVTLLHERHRAGQHLALSVNMSAKTFSEPTIATDIRALLAEMPLPDGRLVVEITETAAITNIGRARDLAKELRLLGCRLALDDFGAGFASFYYLKHLAFDYLKIDGEFIRRLPETYADQLVVRAVVDIAHGLGTQTVAEFVGDQETLDILGQLGVGYAQGYFTGRPGPLETTLPALRAPTPAAS